MRNCVFSLLLTLLCSTATASCATSPPPVATEAPVEPLVIGKTPPVPIATASETAAPPPEDVRVAAATALEIPARDPRLARSRQRSRAVLVTELQALLNLLAATQASAPDRPALIKRLAEGYAELSHSADVPTATSAHRSALKFYEQLATEYPKDPQVDEAYYYAGLEHEMAGDPRSARRSYYELIKTSPQSKLIPLAYFAFGEMFYTEAANDPSKDDLALQAYAEVLKYPPRGNVVYADAQRRVSEVKARKNGGTLTRP